MDVNGRYFILNDWQMLMQHDTIWSKSPLMFVMFIMYHDDVSILFILSHSVHSRVQNVPLTNCGLGKIGVLALLRDPLHLRPPREAKKSVVKRIRHNYFDRFDLTVICYDLFVYFNVEFQDRTMLINLCLHHLHVDLCLQHLHVNSFSGQQNKLNEGNPFASRAILMGLCDNEVSRQFVVDHHFPIFSQLPEIGR